MHCTQQQPQQATVQQPQVGQPQPQQIRLATAGAQPAQQLVTLVNRILNKQFINYYKVMKHTYKIGFKKS